MIPCACAPATRTLQSSTMNQRAQESSTVWVCCLCAAWCRTCDDYRALFESVAAEFQAADASLVVRWIDIEDEAELVGDVDITTFPTLAVVDARGVRFFGALTPQPETLRRQLRVALA